MRFVYRTLAIFALAICAGMAHSWFVPVAASFGGDTERGERIRRDRTTPDHAQGGVPDQGAAPGGEQAPGQAPPDGEGDAGGSEQTRDPGTQGSVEQPVTPEPPPDIDIDALGDFISAQEAHAIWQAGNVEFSAVVAFLDARYADAYAAGHITTARRLLAEEFVDGRGAGVVNWLLQQEPDYVVIYCEGGECDASKNLARQLELNARFAREQLHVLQLGYPAWAENYPDLVTKGDQPGEP